MKLRVQFCYTEKILQDYLRQIIRSTSPPIIAIYLFGSFGRGSERKGSDMDLAFLFFQEMYKSDPFEAMRMASIIATQVGMKFKRETDITILNSASIEFAYEVITSGCCVYETDRDKRLEYEAIIRGMYYDFSPFLIELRSRCIAQL